MCTRAELLEHHARAGVNLLSARENQLIYYSIDGMVSVSLGRVCVFRDEYYITVEYTYPDFEPVRAYYNFTHAKVMRRFGTERRLQKSIEYIDLMFSLILYTGELTKRLSILEKKVIAPLLERDGHYDGPQRLVKRVVNQGGASTTEFKIPLDENLLARECCNAVLDIAHEDPHIFDTWEDKLRILRDGLPQPIFEAIAESAVFLSC